MIICSSELNLSVYRTRVINENWGYLASGLFLTSQIRYVKRFNENINCPLKNEHFTLMRKSAIEEQYIDYLQNFHCFVAFGLSISDFNSGNLPYGYTSHM